MLPIHILFYTRIHIHTKGLGLQLVSRKDYNQPTAYYCVPLALDFVLQALLLHVTVVLVFYNKIKVLILCYSKMSSSKRSAADESSGNDKKNHAEVHKVRKRKKDITLF